MENNLSISGSTNWIVGDYPKDFENIVFMYNTWVTFFYIEYFDSVAFRYKGTRGDAILTDTRRLGEDIISYIENGYEPTIGMITFMQQCRSYPPFGYGLCRGMYKDAIAWFSYAEFDFPVGLESTFFEMIDLFKVESLKKAMDAEGIYIYF